MQGIVVLDDTHLAYWSDRETHIARFTAPREQAHGIEPATGIVTKPTQASDLGLSTVRVAWKPSPEDIAELQAGGVIWLSMWGGLMMHQLEVQPALTDVLRNERKDGRVCPGTGSFITAEDVQHGIPFEHCSIPWAEHSPATQIVTIVTSS